jgi:hypothetical protein
MNLMGKLRQMLGDDEIQRKPQTRATARPAQRMGAYEDGSGVNMGQRPQRQQGVPLNTRGRYEDSQMVRGAQGLVPLSADVGRLYGSEDIGQSEGTLNAGRQLQRPVAPQVPMQTYWQNTDGRMRNMINPQAEDDDNYYF